jgi:hypothetical protein
MIVLAVNSDRLWAGPLSAERLPALLASQSARSSCDAR